MFLPATSVNLAAVEYRALALGENGVTFCDVLGEPPVLNVATSDDAFNPDDYRPLRSSGVVWALDLPPFLRGDANSDGLVSGLVDSLTLLEFGFLGGESPVCADAADVNDDGELSALTDALVLLSYSFMGGSPPPAPGVERCGIDLTTDSLDCAVSACPE